jgi:DNA-directed RNA polymerase beta' subunit
MKLLDIYKKSGESRFKAILSERENCVNTCPFCNQVLPTFSFDEDNKVYIKYKNKNKSSLFSIESIDTIFGNIPPCDIKLIGLNEKHIHPSNLLISALIVIPPCARPAVRNDSGQNHDDLTYKYQEILKSIEKYEKTENLKQRSDHYDSICLHVRTFMDNSKGKAKNQGNKRQIKCVKKRVTSKNGLIRGHVQGKRVNQCARTVITPEANGWVDEIVVPEAFAKKLTFPVYVNSFNLKQCQDFLDKGLVDTVFRNGQGYNIATKCYTRGFEFHENDIIQHASGDQCSYTQLRSKYNIPYGEQPKPDFSIIKEGDKVIRHNRVFTNIENRKKKQDFILEEGDMIERKIQNGDWTLFNRQPTLWKGSMRALKIKILPCKTFRFNLCNTKAWNAD